MAIQDSGRRQQALQHLFGRAQKFINKRRELCLVPGCNAFAIQSHAQSVGMQLRPIAEENWVYAIQSNHYSTARDPAASAPIVRTRMRNASCFPGFCALHDSELFAPLERAELRLGDREQAHLFFLRGVAHEYAVKRQSIVWKRFLIDEGKTLIQPEVLGAIEATVAGNEWFIQRDGSHMLREAWERQVARNFDDLTTVWRRVDKNLGISSSCCFSPLLDRYAEYLIAHMNEPQPNVAVSIIPSAQATHVIASWLPEWDILSDWITLETTTNPGLERFINLIAFAESEDTCIMPSLWEGLDVEVRHAVLRAMMPNHIRGPLEEFPKVVKL